jgi:hypothetical protein
MQHTAQIGRELTFGGLPLVASFVMISPYCNRADCRLQIPRKYKRLRNPLINRNFWGPVGSVGASLSHCGTLTYRHKSPAKRQPSGQIAASQQNKVQNGARRGGRKRDKPISPITQCVGGERRAEAVSHDVLGFGVAIGLIRFVRSASIRG